jgi:hypothetical protein
MTTDELMMAAREAKGDLEAVLDELFELLEKGENVPRDVSERRHPLMCGTCGYATDFGTIERRDAEHLRVDGGHEPGWYDENAPSVLLVRSDADLIRAMLRA